MSELFGQLRQRLEKYQRLRRANELKQHRYPTSENFFWLINYVKKHQLNLSYNNWGYNIDAATYMNCLITPNGSYTSRGVKIRVRQPLKLEGHQVSSFFDCPDGTVLNVRTCVVEGSSDKRIGDLSKDDIVRPAKTINQEALIIRHVGIDGVGPSGAPTGILLPDSESLIKVLQNAYEVIYSVLLNGAVKNQDLLQLESQHTIV